MAAKRGAALAKEMLENLLAERGCSQHELAEYLGIKSQGTIGDVLSGRRQAGMTVRLA